MAAPATQTYVFYINQSDIDRLASEEYFRPLYYHSYIDLVLLGFLLVVSLVSNAVLATTLLTNRYLQQISSYIPILGLTLAHLFDCIFNGLISLTYMSRILWNMGYPLCVFHNYFSHLILGLIPLCLFLAAIDRYTCLNYPEVYRIRFTCAKHRVALAVFAVISGIMGIPYLLSLTPSRPFPARMACAGGYAKLSGYVIGWAMFPVTVPLIFSLIIALLIGRTLCLDRREKGRIQSRAWLEEKGIPSASGFRPPLSQNEIRSVTVWFALFALYVCCSLPYVANEISHQLDSSIAKEEKEHREVCFTPGADVFVAWFRYLATGLHSAVIFIVCEEVRQETGVMLSKWNVKPSSVIEEATTTVDDLVDAGSKSSWAKLLHKNSKSKEGNGGGGSKFTAVLFPSQLGLQMRYWNPVGRDFSYFWCDHLDSCCSVKAQKRKLSDSGYSSLQFERRREIQDNYKRAHDDFDVIIPPKKREDGRQLANKPKIVVNTRANSNVSQAKSKSTVNVSKSNGRSRLPESKGKGQVSRAKRTLRKSKSLERIPDTKVTNRGRAPGQVKRNATQVPRTKRSQKSQSLERFPEHSKSYARNNKKFN